MKPLPLSVRSLVAGSLAACVVAGCREQVFHCEEIGHEIGTVTLSKDVPRQCHELRKHCESSGTSCFTQSRADCFRARSSSHYIFICAPSASECERLQKQRSDVSEE